MLTKMTTKTNVTDFVSKQCYQHRNLTRHRRVSPMFVPTVESKIFGSVLHAEIQVLYVTGLGKKLHLPLRVVLMEKLVKGVT